MLVILSPRQSHFQFGLVLEMPIDRQVSMIFLDMVKQLLSGLAISQTCLKVLKLLALVAW